MLIDEMRAQRKSAISIFAQFIISFYKNTSELFCFFEGDDFKYYAVRIGTTIPRGIVPFSCDGKENVLRVYQLIVQKKLLIDSRVAFFIDRDFDEPINKSEHNFIYETPCYSIENLYTSEATFKNILFAEFGYAVDDPNFVDLIATYNRRQKEFYDALTELNAWVYIHRQIERENGCKKINLQSLDLKKIVNISIDKIEKICSREELPNIVGASLSILNYFVDQQMGKWEGGDKGRIFRGKFNIEFTRKILVDLIEDASKPVPIYIKNGKKPKLSLSRSNIISDLSQYAETPSCLLDFLKKFS